MIGEIVMAGIDFIINEVLFKVGIVWRCLFCFRGCSLCGGVSQGISGLRLRPRARLIRWHNVGSGVRCGGLWILEGPNQY